MKSFSGPQTNHDFSEVMLSFQGAKQSKKFLENFEERQQKTPWHFCMLALFWVWRVKKSTIFGK